MTRSYPHIDDSEREQHAPSAFDAAVEAFCKCRPGTFAPKSDPLDEVPPGPERMKAREQRLLATGVVSLDGEVEAGCGDPSKLAGHLDAAERRLDAKLDRMVARRVLRRRRVERARRPTCARRSPRRRRSPSRRVRSSSAGSRGDPGGDGEPEPEGALGRPLPASRSTAESGPLAAPIGQPAAAPGHRVVDPGFPEPLTPCSPRSGQSRGGRR